MRDLMEELQEDYSLPIKEVLLQEEITSQYLLKLWMSCPKANTNLLKRQTIQIYIILNSLLMHYHHTIDPFMTCTGTDEVPSDVAKAIFCDCQ